MVAGGTRRVVTQRSHTGHAKEATVYIGVGTLILIIILILLLT